MADAGPTILLIKDESGQVFGGYATESWAVSPRCFGTGEAFVFHVHGTRITVHPWSRKNRLFQTARTDFLAVGGGGSFALSVDSELLEGSSGDCETFDSPTLSGNPNFTCIELQAFGLDASMR